MKANLFKILKLFVQDFAFFCRIKKHEENVVELVNRKVKPKVIFISTTDTKDVSKARENANSASKSEVIEQSQQKVGETPQIEETVNVKVEPEMDSVSQTTVMEETPANKTYSPQLVQEANELIYDFLRCRVSDKNLKNFCRKWDNVSGKRYWFVSPNLSFQDDLGLGALGQYDLDITEFIMDFEEKYGKTVSDEDAMRIKTVADFYDIFERYRFNK